MKKLIDSLGSKNFIVSLIAVILFVLKTNGVIDESVTADGLFEQLSGVIDVLLMYIIVPLSKIIKNITKGTFDWSFLKNSNFITMAFTVFTLILTSIFDEQTAGIITSLVMTVLNIFYQFSLPVKNIK